MLLEYIYLLSLSLSLSLSLCLPYELIRTVTARSSHEFLYVMERVGSSSGASFAQCLLTQVRLWTTMS